MTQSAALEAYRLTAEPFWHHTGNEVALYAAAYAARLPVMLKGPTGCGKTRFVEHMAWRLDRPLVTVSCHEDMTASDLVGRFLLGPDGEAGRYRQVHVRSADRGWASAGDGFPVFDTAHGRFGLMLGYDGLFPEAARIMALNGAAAILYPCSWRLAAEPDLIVIERAAENHMAVVAANRTDSIIAAGSRIISGARYPTPQHWKMRFPESTTLRHGVEDARTMSIDVGAMAQKLIAYKTDLIADRMPEHYALLAAC